MTYIGVENFCLFMRDEGEGISLNDRGCRKRSHDTVVKLCALRTFLLLQDLQICASSPNTSLCSIIAHEIILVMHIIWEIAIEVTYMYKGGLIRGLLSTSSFCNEGH